MSKKNNKIILIDDEYEHDVKVNKDRTKYSLKHSSSNVWKSHVKGEELIEIKDTGNSAIVNGDEYEYDQLFYLYLALKTYHEDDPYNPKIEIIGRQSNL